MSAGTDLAAAIDHTLLRPEAGVEDIRRLCAEAVDWGFAAVCVNPVWVGTAVAAVAGSTVRVASVCGFPLGANETAVKVEEARRAMDGGAREIDMVQHLGAAVAGAWDVVEADVAAVAGVVHAHDGELKVILECGLLDDDAKREAARRAVAAGADWVKTSTGFLAGGATVADIELLRVAVRGAARVKASGGIRSVADARMMLAAGAERLGTSSGVAIMRDAGGQG
jgi:deoxyribose-phosphate aldolase